MKRNVTRAVKPASIPSMDAQTARRVDAEIAKLIAESTKLNAESTKFGAEVAKLIAEASKYQRERAWYPVVIMATAIGATATVVKVVFS